MRETRESKKSRVRSERVRNVGVCGEVRTKNLRQLRGNERNKRSRRISFNLIYRRRSGRNWTPLQSSFGPTPLPRENQYPSESERGREGDLCM